MDEISSMTEEQWDYLKERIKNPEGSVIQQLTPIPGEVWEQFLTEAPEPNEKLKAAAEKYREK